MSSFKRLVTRDEVAKQAGVSPATVSYVVNNGPRPVSPETQQKVLAAIQELGYKPNAVARSLRLQKTNTIGLILPDTHNPFFAEVVRGVEKVALERGFSVILCHSDYSLSQEIHYVNVLQSERVAGVLWFPATDDPSPAILLAEYEIPLVILDRVVPGLQALSIVADNFRGGYLAVEHLIQNGHRRIGCIARPSELSHSQERVRGYRAALLDHGLPIEPELIIRGGFRMEDGRLATHRLLELDPAPSAIFTYNDFMAIGALRAAHERGLSVPRDVSIVGFDDIPQAAYTVPALTTVQQSKLEMGCRGAESLLELSFGKEPGAFDQTPLEVQLIVRESTGKRFEK
jgi:LacI family transcriptional regulator